MRLSPRVSACLVALTLASLVVACDGKSTPSSTLTPTASATSPAAQTDADLAAILATAGFAPSLSVQDTYTKVRPPYEVLYESCLIAFAVTKAANGRPIADVYCHGAAVSGSGKDRPNPLPEETRAYWSCLYGFTVDARRTPNDLVGFCRSMAVGG